MPALFEGDVVDLPQLGTAMVVMVHESRALCIGVRRKLGGGHSFIKGVSENISPNSEVTIIARTGRSGIYDYEQSLKAQTWAKPTDSTAEELSTSTQQSFLFGFQKP